MDKHTTIGLHIRLTHTLADVAEKAVRLGIKQVQSFFIYQATNTMIEPTEADVQAFLAVRREHFDNLFVHGSYWINLAGVKQQGMCALRKELDLAKRLEFTHIVLHPGSAKGAATRREGIDILARSLNKVLKQEQDIQVVLENTAHGKMSMGGDLQEFRLLLEKVDQPDRLQFCLDTAHAYTFGYDIADPTKQQLFLDEVAQTIGFERIALIHLNDTQERCGSKIDRHACIGHGKIGNDALRTFVQHPEFASIPVIMELPELEEEQEQHVLGAVRAWYK